MFDEINARLEQARTQRDQQQALRGSLPRLHEELKRETYRLESLESCLAEVEEQVRKLESASLGALVASLMGNKAAQLAERKHELADFQQQFDACAAVVAELTDKFERAQSGLSDDEAAASEYDALIEEKQKLILDGPVERAEQLAEVLNSIDQAKQYRSGVERAVQSGHHASERMHTLTKSAGRARKKGISSVAGGVLIAAAVNTAMKGATAKPALKRVAEGLETLHEDINKLEWNPDEPRDQHVLELAAAIAGFAANVQSTGARQLVSDTSSLGPVLDAVQETIGHLKDISAEMTDEIKSLEAERTSIVESA